eukprot:11214105-Alexandrium_andersonii.AAC.1
MHTWTHAQTRRHAQARADKRPRPPEASPVTGAAAESEGPLGPLRPRALAGAGPPSSALSPQEARPARGDAAERTAGRCFGLA